MSKNEKLYSFPGFKKYFITKEGRIWSGVSKKWLTASRNPAGYYNYTMMTDDNKHYTMGRHRALCIAFKPLEGVNLNALLVNHINGIPGDDWLDNLEWETYQGNVEHAGRLGLTTKCIPCQVMNVDTGKITKYPSAIKAAIDLRIPKDMLLWRLKHGEQCVYPERNQYRTGWSDAPWEINPDPDKSIAEYGNAKGVYVKNLDTLEVTLFSSMAAVSKEFNISGACLSKRFKKENQPWFLPNLLMKLVVDKEEWRDSTDKYIEYENSTCSKVVILISEDLTKSQVFLSAKECSEKTGISHSTVLWRVNSDTKPFYEGYSFHYYSNQHLVRLGSNS